MKNLMSIMGFSSAFLYDCSCGAAEALRAVGKMKQIFSWGIDKAKRMAGSAVHL